MTDCIRAAVKNQITNLETYFKRFHKEITEDDVHDFRVSVKRLRAYRYFLRVVNQENPRIGDSLEMAYLIAGRIRDVTNISTYLKISQTNKTKSGRDLEQLDTMSRVYTQDFKSLILSDAYILSDISESIQFFPGTSPDVRKSELNLILNSIFANISEELIKKVDEIDFHEVRKLFKKLSYLFELVNEYSPSVQSQKNLNIAIKVEKRMGIWHDIHVLRLEENCLESINDQTINMLEVKYGIDDREELLCFIRESLDDFSFTHDLKKREL